MPQELNVYAYVQNDPINGMDPVGLIPWSPKCWWSIFQAKQTCGNKHSQALRELEKHVDWCEDAWWWCVSDRYEKEECNGNPVPEPMPTNEQCESLCDLHWPSHVRLACLNSPQLTEVLKVSGQCLRTLIKVVKDCGLI
jgi:hypothetical protein